MLDIIDVLGVGFVQVKANGGGLVWINPMTISYCGINELGSVVFTMANGQMIPTIHPWDEWVGLFPQDGEGEHGQGKPEHN